MYSLAVCLDWIVFRQKLSARSAICIVTNSAAYPLLLTDRKPTPCESQVKRWPIPFGTVLGLMVSPLRDPEGDRHPWLSSFAGGVLTIISGGVSGYGVEPALENSCFIDCGTCKFASEPRRGERGSGSFLVGILSDALFLGANFVTLPRMDDWRGLGF